jgi:ribosome-binding protein aMBF1 (putative translation factor)
VGKHNSFNDFMQEVEDEAKAEGPEAVEELETFRAYFRLAKEMAAARKAKGLSQQQLANKCGIHQSEISDIERGRANPTFRTLQTIARRLDRRIMFMAMGSKASGELARKDRGGSRSATQARRKHLG